MASNAMNTTALACWIPSYQAAKALAALEKSLVIEKCVTSDWRDQLKWGDTLNIAITPDLGTADSVDLTGDLTLNAQNTTRGQIVVNQWNYKAVGVGYREQMQNRPDYLTEVAEKCVYSCAKAVDYYLGGLFSSLQAGNIGTQGSALTDDVMLSGVEYLDVADVGRNNRFLVVDPESITDLLKIDKFLRDDYVNKGAVESPEGLIGRSVYGCTVYMSNNLTLKNTYYHAAAMLQKEAIGLILQKNPITDMFDWKEKFTNVVRAQAVFGAAVLRTTAGCCINTRS
jgi:hypothetical protein